jgi:nascent polypeptide-associated complex subunit alpha
MMPNMDPRAMKNLMAKMGIKSSEIDAQRVIIETADQNIIIENPQVNKIEAQGTVSFQISGDITESAKEKKIEVTQGDIDLVAEKTGISDNELIRNALLENNGDIAQAIIALTGEN